MATGTIKKVTVGFVIQDIDVKTGKITGQEFIAGDEVTYENIKGEVLDVRSKKLLDAYLPFEMIQPEKE